MNDRELQRSGELQRSKAIASVLGPSLIVITVSEIINFHIWAEFDPRLTYLNGMILFVAGFAIIRFHHRWRPLWTATITVTGGLMTIGGLIRLFFPAMDQASPGPFAYGLIGVLCAAGLVMTVMGYRRGS